MTSSTERRSTRVEGSRIVHLMMHLVAIGFLGFLKVGGAKTPWEHLLFALPLVISLIVQLIAIARGADEAALKRQDRRLGWLGVMVLLPFALVMVIIGLRRGDASMAGLALLMALAFCYVLFSTRSKR